MRLLRYIKYINKLLLGRLIYLKKRNKMGYRYFMPATGFGEIKAVYSILPLIKEKNQRFKILIQESRSEILDIMPTTDNIELISAKEYQALVSLVFNCATYKAYVSQMNNSLLFTSIDPYIKPELMGQLNNLRLLDVTKKIVGVSGDNYLHFQLPKQEIEYNHVVKKYDIVKGKTVFFNINARTVKGIPFAFFEECAHLLKARGFEIRSFVNNQKETTVLNSLGIIETIENSAALVQYGGYLLGIRSGFFDIMVDFNCCVISVCKNDFKNKNYFELCQWPGKACINEIYYYDGESSKAMKKMMNIVEEYSAKVIKEA